MNEADELSEAVVERTEAEAVDGMTEDVEVSNADQEYSPNHLAFVWSTRALFKLRCGDSPSPLSQLSLLLLLLTPHFAML